MVIKLLAGKSLRSQLVTSNIQRSRMLDVAARSSSRKPLERRTCASATRPDESTFTFNTTTPFWPRCCERSGKLVGLALTVGAQAASVAGEARKIELVANKSSAEVFMAQSPKAEREPSQGKRGSMLPCDGPTDVQDANSLT